MDVLTVEGGGRLVGVERRPKGAEGRGEEEEAGGAGGVAVPLVQQGAPPAAQVLTWDQIPGGDTR